MARLILYGLIVLAVLVALEAVVVVKAGEADLIVAAVVVLYAALKWKGIV